MVVGVQRLFALRVWAALRHRRNEDGYVKLARWLAKSVTEKNNRRDGNMGKGFKYWENLAKYLNSKLNKNILPNGRI